MKWLSASVLTTCIVVLNAPNVTAQDNPSLVVSYFECDWSDVGPWMQQTDSLALPIYQELVDEGMLLGFGTLVHDFAGYENVIVWRSAASVDANISANTEFARRMNERHPDLEGAGCADHRDAFYRLGPNTGPTPEGMQTMVLGYFRCDPDVLGDIYASVDSLLMPVARELVAEGKFGSYGLLFHDWATRENVIVYRSAPDRNTFFEGWTEVGRRMGERHPDADPFHGCSAHRDGIYGIGPRTTPAATDN